MSGLAEFLIARIAEDEVAARACAEVYPAPWHVTDRGWTAYVMADAPDFRHVVDLEDQTVSGGDVWLGDALDHIARWDPARVLAECEAKREVVDLHKEVLIDRPDDDVGIPYDALCEVDNDDFPCRTLRLLALPFADHPDYRQEWERP